MPFDLTVSGWVMWVILAVIVVSQAHAAWKFGSSIRDEHLVNPDRRPWFNVGSNDKRLTPEGRAWIKAQDRHTWITTAIIVVVFLVFDLFT